MSKASNAYGKIINVLAWISLVFAVFFVVFSVMASVSGEQDAKEIFGVKAYIVNSDSMSKSETSLNEEIFFKSGDIILVKRPENVLLLKEGDVITFVSTNTDSYGLTVTHKIREVVYSVNGDIIGYVTYGINTGVDDEVIVTPENVTGIYLTKIAGLGKVFSFLKTPAGYFTSILTPLVLIIIFFSVRIGKIVERRGISEETVEIRQVEKASPTTSKQEVLVTVKVVIENGNLSVVSNDSQNLENKIKEEIFEDVTVTETTENIITEEEQGEAMAQTLEEKIEAFSKTKVVKLPVSEKILALDDEIKSYFENIHNELIGYKKVHARISLRCISYRLGRKLLAKASVRGKTLLLHFALNVDEFDKKLYFQRDLSNLKSYSEVPFTVKLKSARGEKRAMVLVQTLMEKNNVIKNAKATSVDLIAELKNQNLNKE